MCLPITLFIFLGDFLSWIINYKMNRKNYIMNRKRKYQDIALHPGTNKQAGWEFIFRFIPSCLIVIQHSIVLYSLNSPLY